MKYEIYQIVMVIDDLGIKSQVDPWVTSCVGLETK